MHLILRICLLLCLAVPGLPGQTRAAAEKPSLPVAVSGKIAGDESTTRFVINFDRSVRLRTFYMDEPYRLVMDLEETVFQFGEADKPEPRGLVKEVRFGRISEGRSRVVLTLSAPAEVSQATIRKPPGEENYRFVLDFDATKPERFAALLETQAREIGESGGVATRGDRINQSPVQSNDDAGKFTIVIDPGHGGIDGGATGRDGAIEKDIVLAVALGLAREIRLRGPYRVLLTREDDRFVSLSERVNFSRRSEADLFISIHADSLRQRWVRGATIYTLAKKASDKLSAELAASENAADLVAGLAVQSDAEAVTDILADLTTRETKRFSKSFSKLLVRKLGDEIQLIKNPLRSAAFGVLKSPDVPGVLIEIGYLSNEEDEKLLQKPEWQDRVAKTIALAVDGFFTLRKTD